MTVTVLFFGHWRDVAGERQTVVLADGSNAATLLEQLAQQDSRLTSISQTCRFAVNEEFASTEILLFDGDVVAMLPPMSGG